MRKIFYYTLGVSIVLLSACAKDKKVITKPGDTTVATTSALDLIKDSVYLYTLETSLWYNGMPDYKTFNPRSITGSSDLIALQTVVDKLSQYTINPSTGKPYEYNTKYPGESKYSFIDDGSTGTELGGTNGDFGFSVFYPVDNDLRIKYVFPGSPAGLAGLKRGYQITKINNRTAIQYDNGDNLNFVVNAIFGTDAKTLTMTVLKPDKTTQDVTINVTNYTINPVLATKVVELSGGKKVGYMVYNVFTDVSNSGPKLLDAFTTFQSAGITDLVVDLRYNGGGRQNAAEYLANLIAPSSKTGTTMFTTVFNDKMTKGIHPLLDKIYDLPSNYFAPSQPQNNTKFNKVGSLNLSKVFFIVTNSTASASELVINSLLPEMNVQIIGATTYGKPVGFFPIDINKYQLYTVQSKVTNSAGKADYFAGMTPGSTDFPGVYDTSDDVTKDFGDTTEALFSHALDYIKTGTFSVSKPRVQSLSVTTRSIDQINYISRKLDRNKFKGLVMDKAAPHK